jgi:predicted AAA+ superfamily ATPase
VYLDLRRLGCQVHYYVTKEGYEIDFLTQTLQGKKKLFQVVWQMDTEKTSHREDRALQAGMNELNIEGEIVTLESYLKHRLQV